MSIKEKLQSEHLVRMHACDLSDMVLCLVHLLASKKYDEASETLLAIKRKTDTTAGFVSQLLPCTRTNEQLLDERNHAGKE